MEANRRLPCQVDRAFDFKNGDGAIVVRLRHESGLDRQGPRRHELAVFQRLHVGPEGEAVAIVLRFAYFAYFLETEGSQEIGPRIGSLAHVEHSACYGVYLLKTVP